MTLTEQLRDAREDAKETKIALRHAENAANDYLVWFDGQTDFTALGKNDPARKKARAELLAKDGRAIKFEQTVRDCQDDADDADCKLECLLDEVKAGNAQTWAILAEWVRGRTPSGRMGAPETAGREMLREQVEEEFQF